MMNYFFDNLYNSVQKFPEKISIEDRNGIYTYKELWERSVFLSRQLEEKGIRKGDRIGIFIGNNIDFVVCTISVMALGAIFVPISMEFPDNRILNIIDDCRLKVILTNIDVPENISYFDLYYNIVKNEKLEKNYTDWFVKRIQNITDDMLVYIIYTSGSTGHPKGVAIKWAGLENYIIDTNNRMGFNVDTKSLNMTSFCFDGALTGIFCMLSCTGTLVIGSRVYLKSITLYDILVNRNITDIGCTPIQLEQLENALKLGDVNRVDLQTVSIGGESFSKCQIVNIYNYLPNVKIYNRYGPTETTIVASSYEIKKADLAGEKPIPIGRPISNMFFYAYDENMNLIKPGEIGELYIGGIQVMKEYWNDPILTENVIFERIVDGKRLYKTSDLVTINADGEYIFIGRKDDLIKINGYRIYLSEIDNALRRLIGIADACSILVNSSENKRIVAFVICKCNYKKETIKKELLNTLPSYMLPYDIILLNMFPETKNGKIDKKKLLEKYREIQNGIMDS